MIDRNKNDINCSHEFGSASFSELYRFYKFLMVVPLADVLVNRPKIAVHTKRWGKIELSNKLSFLLFLVSSTELFWHKIAMASFGLPNFSYKYQLFQNTLNTSYKVI